MHFTCLVLSSPPKLFCLCLKFQHRKMYKFSDSVHAGQQRSKSQLLPELCFERQRVIPFLTSSLGEPAVAYVWPG